MSSHSHDLTSLTPDAIALCACGHTSIQHGAAGCRIGTCECGRFLAPLFTEAQAERIDEIREALGMDEPSPIAEAIGVEEPAVEEVIQEAVVEAFAAPPPASPPKPPRIEYSCLRCGHHWKPSRKFQKSGQRPRACALCRSTYWDALPQLARANSPDPLRREDMRLRRDQWKMDREQKLARGKFVDLAIELGEEVVMAVVGSIYPSRMNPVPLPVPDGPRIRTGIVGSMLPPPPEFK